MNISPTNFVNKNGVLIPKSGTIGGKSEGLVRSLDILPDLEYRQPSSLLAPAECLDSAISAFPRHKLILGQRPDYDRIIEILSSDQHSLIDMIVETFPKRAVIRSSDINEDSLKNRLPGFYKTEFVGNFDDSKYRKGVISAIAGILTDYLQADKVAFRSRKEMKDGLGLLVQDVIGRMQGDEYVNELLGIEKFYPDLAGYLNAAFPDKVIVGFCKGLGLIAVEGKEHYVYEYSRSTGKVKKVKELQHEVTFFENGRLTTKSIDKQLTITEEFVRAFVEKVLEFDQRLRFPEGYGLDFEFAIPSLEGGVVYSTQNAPLPIKRGTVAIEPAKSPIVTPASYVGVGSKVFTDFVFIPSPPGIAQRGGPCPYDYNLSRYNESHSDYLIFILPQHILVGGTESKGTYKFTNTYNAGGIVEVHEHQSTHAAVSGADHFRNFIRCLDQLFIAGNPTEYYWKMKEGKTPDKNSSLIVGKGEVYMAVDENNNKGVIDLRRIDEIKIYGG